MGARKKKPEAESEESSPAEPTGGSPAKPPPTTSMQSMAPVRAVPYSGRFRALLDPNDNDDEDDIAKQTPPEQQRSGPVESRRARRGALEKAEKAQSSPSTGEGSRHKTPAAAPNGAPQASDLRNEKRTQQAPLDASAAKGVTAKGPPPDPAGPHVTAAPPLSAPAANLKHPQHPQQHQQHQQQGPKPGSAAAEADKGAGDDGKAASGRQRGGGREGPPAPHRPQTPPQHHPHSHRRRFLRRMLQWVVALTAVGLALLATNRRLLEEGPISEFLPEGISSLPGLLNVSIASLPSFASLPRPSLDSLLSSTGFNASVLVTLSGSLTDTLAELTDTLNDLSDTISGGSLTVTAQLRGLLAQLPAFSLPQLSGSGAAGASGAGTGANATTAGRPGLAMARLGYQAKHPVVIVPGFVTSGLELWRGLPCGRKYFRQRMWGTLAMVQAYLTDPTCWFRHMELDPVTGLDPEGIKVRAAAGLEAVDYFIQGYWVWGKLVEALADVGYDSNSLVSMSYDWRLAMPLLEERDGYFTRLRSTIESLTEINGERVVIATHSYGENVVRSFMSWVEKAQGGAGWVERHMRAVVNIAGTTLGVPKSVSALLSGETRDTAQLGALAGFLSSNLVPRAVRTRVWRTWGASYAMLPVGGPRVWGNVTWAPDDTPEMRAAQRTYGAMVSLWPHNWQQVFAAAAAAAAPQQRQQLSELVANISQAATNEEDEGCSGEGAEPWATGSPDAGNAASAAAANNDTAGGAGKNALGGGSSSSSSGSSSSSSSGSSRSPISRIAGTLKKLVGSGTEVDPLAHLDSEKVSRLDVDGFVSLLRDVGGQLVDEHSREWGAVDVSPGSKEAELLEAQVAARAARAADPSGVLAEQAAGGADTLRSRSTRQRLPLFPDATRTPLPNAPSTAIVCLYGVGLPTERGYHYLRPAPQVAQSAAEGRGGGRGGGSGGNGSGAADGAVAAAAAGLTAAEAGQEEPTSTGERGDGGGGGGQAAPPPHSPGGSGEEANTDAGGDASGGWMIMKDVTQPDGRLDVGVHLSDGDGTVPLLSLGLMCRGGWRQGSPLNPAGLKVVTREYKHRSVSMLQDARGGPATAAHIDILGNEAVLHDVIKVAAGRMDELEDVIVSDIDRIVAAADI